VIAIIDYGVGNLKSIFKALAMVGGNPTVTRKIDEILSADSIILPGVGAVKPAMDKLRDVKEYIKSSEIPVLGICLGMQIFATESLEGGRIRCLDIIPGVVERFPSSVGKIPHMGWNQLEKIKEHPILSGIKTGSYFYFVHSYYFRTDTKYVVGNTKYGIEFPSVVAKENFIGVQFHPEKSGENGLKLLKNFIEL
jgi:glutamine amidotransferase